MSGLLTWSSLPDFLSSFIVFCPFPALCLLPVVPAKVQAPLFSYLLPAVRSLDDGAAVRHPTTFQRIPLSSIARPGQLLSRPPPPIVHRLWIDEYQQTAASPIVYYSAIEKISYIFRWLQLALPTKERPTSPNVPRSPTSFAPRFRLGSSNTGRFRVSCSDPSTNSPANPTPQLHPTHQQPSSACVLNNAA